MNTPHSLLADRLRPSFSHSENLIGPAKRIWERDCKRWLSHSKFHLVFWGKPGSGKTTLARMLQEGSHLPSVSLSAVKDGVKDIREALESRVNKEQIIFIDEIHRLNKAQQDVLLPFMEFSGDSTGPRNWIIGATTEYPGTCLNPAIISRMRLIHIKEPSVKETEAALQSAYSLLSREIDCLDLKPLIPRLAKISQGDLRLGYNLLENLTQAKETDELEEILTNTISRFSDKKHYDYISAMIKSMRGSDPDAALFYALHALDMGEDILFILRRCIIFASEDIGNADPQALNLAINCYQSAQFVGLPEAAIPLAQCVTYLSATVKSNRSYVAISKVREWKKEALENQGEAALAPPLPITLQGREQYQYPHDYPQSFVKFSYLPESVERIKNNKPAYLPSQTGVEDRLRSRLMSLWDEKK